MRKATIGWLLVAAAVLAGACARYGAAAGTSSTGGTMPLEGTTWTLVELGGRPARPAGADAPNLRLDGAQKRAGGNTGCNSFGGEYELNGDALRFGIFASTRRACVDDTLNAQEASYLRALSGTRTWRITGGTLVLSGESGVVARFAANEAG